MDPETQLGTVLDGVDQTFRMQILVAFGGVEASKVHVIIYIDIYIYSVVVIIESLGINEPSHRKHVRAILKWVGPP